MSWQHCFRPTRIHNSESDYRVQTNALGHHSKITRMIRCPLY